MKRTLRILLNWVVALAVLGALVFFVQQLFEREDPRRPARDHAGRALGAE